jgi:hypothetical protein
MKVNLIILSNQYVPSNRTIPNNKPDIIYDNEKGRCVSVDVAISEGRNVIKKNAEKILKYNKDITVEIPCMWNVKT